MKTVRTIIISLVLAVFMWFLSVGITIGVSMNDHGPMAGCPFMAGMESMCPITFAQYVSRQLEAVSSSTVIERVVAASAVGIAFMLFFVFLCRSLLAARYAVFRSCLRIFRNYIREDVLNISIAFREALYSGVIQPKIFFVSLIR